MNSSAPGESTPRDAWETPAFTVLTLRASARPSAGANAHPQSLPTQVSSLPPMLWTAPAEDKSSPAGDGLTVSPRPEPPGKYDSGGDFGLFRNH
jgi:hypothetical protein